MSEKKDDKNDARLHLGKRKIAAIILCIIILISIIIIAIYPNGFLKLILGDDYVELNYAFNITSNNSNVNYYIKLPIPSNWTLTNDVLVSEGNVSIHQIKETRVVNQYNISKTMELDYLEINGSGNCLMKFNLKDKDLYSRNISFVGVNLPNETMDIFVSMTPSNDSIHCYFGLSNSYKSPSHTSAEYGGSIRGEETIEQNGWFGVKIESSIY